MSDVVERSKAVLENTTPGPWEVNREGWACISSGSDSVFHAYVETTCVECDAEITQSMDCHVAISIEDAEFIAQARTLVPELVAEIERLHTWDGLMSLVDEHYPTDIFPHFAGVPDNPDRDPGPRILSLLREVERLRAACKTLGQIIGQTNRMALDITGLHHLIGEDGDGDWAAVGERLAELGSERDAANAEAERLRATVERVRELIGREPTTSLANRILAALEADR